MNKNNIDKLLSLMKRDGFNVNNISEYNSYITFPSRNINIYADKNNISITLFISKFIEDNELLCNIYINKEQLLMVEGNTEEEIINKVSKIICNFK